MERYLWLFPVVFIFHDMEEIIGLGIWQTKNGGRIRERFPKAAPMLEKLYADYSTEGMAVAVMEELILCIAVCVGALVLADYHLWIGLLVAFFLHLLVHLVQAILWRGYIPAVITSILVMPVTAFLIGKSLQITNYSLPGILGWSALGVLIVGGNLKFAHALMHWFVAKQRR